MLVDQSPVSRSPRSNPVTYVKAFNEIRAVFAETDGSQNADPYRWPFQLDGGLGCS